MTKLSLHIIKAKLTVPTSPFLLGAFRVLFACLALYSAIRFWAKGWIEQLYISPEHHFKFFGFSWVQLPESTTAVYLLFSVMITSAIGMLLGKYFRLFASAYFLLFTYFELIDATYYLNHYYFISLLALLVIFLPMNNALIIGKSKAKKHPFLFVAALRLLVGAVYFYAGIAKINTDWLAGEPLNTWYNAFEYLPIIGETIGSKNFAVFSAYLAMVFDITLPFLLLFKTSRIWAYLAALVFHCLTAIMFPIGVFPLVMSVCALVFFPTKLWEKRIRQLKLFKTSVADDASSTLKKWQLYPITTLLLLHLLFPLRHLLYPGNVMWHEQGFRFSWRVMLMEKNALTELTVVDAFGKKYLVDNREFLTPLQEKMMGTQPDLILQYSQIIAKDFEKKGFNDFKIVANSLVSLNGRKTFRMIQNSVDLRTKCDGFAHKTWISPWNGEKL